MRTILKWSIWCIVACAFCGGCLIVPTNYYTADSRKNIRDGTMPEILPGKTTKEEVFLMLGEPDEVSSDERRMAYRWTKVRALWAAGSYGSGVAGSIEKESGFVITFGDDGVVSGKKVEARYKAGK